MYLRCVQYRVKSDEGELIVNNGSVAVSNAHPHSPFITIPCRNVDGSQNVMGWVCHYTIQLVRIYSRDSQSYHLQFQEASS